MMKLYSYFRSSAAYRVRIALAVKNIPYDIVPVHLINNGGEQNSEAYRAVNPQGVVPTLDHDGAVIAQSMAVIEYLDDVFPQTPMVWGGPAEKALIRRLSQMIACDIHPLNNLGPRQYIGVNLGADDAQKKAWVAHWAHKGMAAFEAVLKESGSNGRFCVGDRVSMADACLIPQMYNMRREGLDISAYPLCRSVEAHCAALPAFQAASPEMQADAPGDLEAIHGPKFKAA